MSYELETTIWELDYDAFPLTPNEDLEHGHGTLSAQ